MNLPKIEPIIWKGINPIKKEPEDIINELVEVNNPEPMPEPKQLEKIELLSEIGQIQGNWDQVINELEVYFKSITIPDAPIKLNQFTLISNVSFFINSHLAIVNAQNGKQTYLPYLKRLQELKLCLN